MANINITKNSATRVLGSGLFKTEVLIDCAANNASANDVFQCINVKAGDIITGVWIMVVVAEGANSNGFDVGDGDSTEAYDASVSLDGSAKTITKCLEATDAYGVGRFYAADDTIDFIPLDDVDTGKYLMVAVGFHVEDAVTLSTLLS